MLEVLDVTAYEYVGLSTGFIRHTNFCNVPEYVEEIQKFFSLSGITAFTGPATTDVRQPSDFLKPQLHAVDTVVVFCVLVVT